MPLSGQCAAMHVYEGLLSGRFVPADSRQITRVRGEQVVGRSMRASAMHPDVSSDWPAPLCAKSAWVLKSVWQSSDERLLRPIRTPGDRDERAHCRSSCHDSHVDATSSHGLQTGHNHGEGYRDQHCDSSTPQGATACSTQSGHRASQHDTG